jgi:recombination protein RecA
MAAAKNPATDRIDHALAGKLVSDLAKKHGSALIRRASAFGTEPVPRLPTGVFMLDYGLGGGFPAGRVNIVYGHKSSGKTTVLLKMIANTQKMCADCWQFVFDGKCACKRVKKPVVSYIDVEGTWDASWAKTHGVDLDDLILSVPEYAEQSLDLADGFIRSGDVDIVILDSIAFLVPSLEIETSLDKSIQMGSQPRLVGSGIRKIVSGLNAIGNERGYDKRPTMFLTNQVRMKIGMIYGNPETQPGGMAPGFAASTETKFWSGKYEMDETTNKPLYVNLEFKVEKNKTSAAKISGEYKMMLADTETKRVGQILEEDRMVELGERMLMIEKVGGDYTCFGEKYAAKSHIERRLMTDAPYKLKYAKALLTVLQAA